MSFASAKQVIDQAASLCIGCGRCTQRCAVLEEKDAAGNLLSACEGGAGSAPGDVAAGCTDAGAAGAGTRLVDGADTAAVVAEDFGNDAPFESVGESGGACAAPCAPSPSRGMTAGSLAAVFSAANNEQELAVVAAENAAAVFAVRRCFMCGYCTLKCPTHVDARGMFTALRELFSLAGVVDGSGFTMTQVDKEWDCFTAYRAVYGIWYVDLPQIEDAPALQAETLFFPGCPLASYSPDLTRQAFSWLQENEGPAVFTDACCGSPLKTAGYGDRAEAYKKSLMERIISAKIKRIVCVCPGCAEELQSALDAAFEMQDLAPLRGGTPSDPLPEIVALPQLLADAGVHIDVARARELAGADPCADSAAGTENTSSDANQAACIAPFDSCHDRSGMFGRPLRALLDVPGANVVELAHHGENALCCGGAGAVSLVDPDIKNQRIDYLFKGEAAQVGADLLVSNCPTCTYTAAQKRRADAQAGQQTSHAAPCNYLELVFPGRFDWDTVFSQLEGMWSGQYAAWVRSVLL